MDERNAHLIDAAIGHETTGYLLSFTLILVLQHPDVLGRYVLCELFYDLWLTEPKSLVHPMQASGGDRGSVAE